MNININQTDKVIDDKLKNDKLNIIFLKKLKKIIKIYNNENYESFDLFKHSKKK